MATFIRIKGWDKYQHYKDRNPPWIKLHMELLTSLTWALADDASRVLAIALMMLAAKNDNRIPANADYVKRVAYLHALPDFSQLIHLEFIEFIDDKGNPVTHASSTLADASKPLAFARPETETETYTEKEKPSRRKAPCDSRFKECVEILERYHKKFVSETGFDVWFGNRGGKQLKNLLNSEPQLDVKTFEQAVGARARSPGMDHEQLVYQWVFHVIGSNRGKANGNGNYQTAAAARTARNLEILLPQPLGDSVQGVHVPDGRAVQPRAKCASAGANGGFPDGEILARQPQGTDA